MRTEPLLSLTAASVALPDRHRAWHDWPLQDALQPQMGDYERAHLGLMADYGIAPARYSEALRPFWQGESDAVFVEATGQTQSELAVAAVQGLLSKQPDLPARCGLAIYSHTAIDEDLVLSTPCRLISECGLTKAHALAIAQCQGASFYQALAVAEASLRADPALQAGLLVAGEKWLPPFPRLVGATALQSDAAVALLMQPSTAVPDSLPALVLLDHEFRQFEQAYDPYSLLDPLADRSRLAAEIVGTVESLLQRRQLRAGDLALCLPQGLRAELRAEVAQGLGLSAAQQWPIDANAYLGAADTPYRLAKLLATLPQRPELDGRLVLSWGLGLGGCTAAALWQVRVAGE